MTAIVDTPPEEEDVLVRSNYLPVILYIIYHILGEEGSRLCHSEDGRAPKLTPKRQPWGSEKQLENCVLADSELVESKAMVRDFFAL